MLVDVRRVEERRKRLSVPRRPTEHELRGPDAQGPENVVAVTVGVTLGEVGVQFLQAAGELLRPGCVRPEDLEPESRRQQRQDVERRLVERLEVPGKRGCRITNLNSCMIPHHRTRLE